MKNLELQIVRHGEVILKQVSELPKDIVLELETKKHIVAHSETGHHHVLESKTPFQVFKKDDEVYISMTEMAELWHQKTGKDVHAPHKLSPAIFKVVIKKQFDYFAKKMANVRD